MYVGSGEPVRLGELMFNAGMNKTMKKVINQSTA